MGLISKPSDVHIDAALTSFSLELPIDDAFIQDLVCPVHPVSKESDKYFVYDNITGKDYDVRRGLGAEAHQFEMSLSTDSYSCEEFATKTPIPFRMINNSDEQVDLEQDATRFCVEILRRKREVRVANIIQSVSNWGGNTAITTPWNQSGADPESDIDAAALAFMANAGCLPNSAVISYKVYRTLIKWLRAQPTGMTYESYRSVDFREPLVGSSEQLRGLFGIDNWFVGRAMKDTADVGDSFSGAFIWNDNINLMYIDSAAGRLSKTALKGMVNQDFTVIKYDSVAKASMFVEAGHILDEKVTASTLGYVLTNVLA